MQGWQMNTTGTTSAVTFVTGPSFVPAGAGSVQLDIGAFGGDFAEIRNPAL